MLGLSLRGDALFSGRLSRLRLHTGAAEEAGHAAWTAERDPAQRVVASCWDWDEQHHWMVKTRAAQSILRTPHLRGQVDSTR